MKNHEQVQSSLLPGNVEVLRLALEIHYGIHQEYCRSDDAAGSFTGQ